MVLHRVLRPGQGFARTLARPVEETAARPAAASARRDETFERRLRQRATEARVEAVRAGLPGLREVERDPGFVEHRERSERPAAGDGRSFDGFDRNSFRRHRDRFVEISSEHPCREEAWAIAHEHRPFARAADERERRSNDIARSERAGYDFDERHAFSRRKEMQAKKARWVGQRPRQPFDREPGSIAGEDGPRRGSLDGRKDFVLQGALFRHALDHEVAIPQAGPDCGCFDPGENPCRDRSIEPSTGDLPGQRCGEPVATPLRGAFVAPAQDDRGAADGEGLRDA